MENRKSGIIAKHIFTVGTREENSDREKPRGLWGARKRRSRTLRVVPESIKKWGHRH